MSSSQLNQIAKRASQLPRAERIALANMLLAYEGEIIPQHLEEEVKRRLAAVESGSIEWRDFAELKAQLRAEHGV